MRSILFCLVGLMTAPTDIALAQMKLSPRAATAANEVRYFTSIDGLMNGNADVILKESRQGKNVTSAVLDVCYPAAKGSDRKDRFVANLTVNGQTLTGATQSLGDKLPVTVKLLRKPTGDTFEFRGQISVGQTVTEVTSTDNSDLSEKEFLDNQSTDDGIDGNAKGFYRSVSGSDRRAGEAGRSGGFPQGTERTGRRGHAEQRGRHLRRAARRRTDHQYQRRSGPRRRVDCEVEVVSRRGRAGWTSGVVEMERTIRFAAAEWRDGDTLNKDKLGAAIANVLTKTLSAKSSTSVWNATTGKLKLTLKRPSQILPALDLTETVEVTALVSSDKPGPSDRLMLWIGNPVISTADESAGPKLKLADESSNDEEADQKDDNGSVDALAREFRGQRWDTDKSAWK